MLIDCSPMSTYRSSCGLASFITAYRAFQPQMSSNKLYSLFLNDSNLDILRDRTLDLYHMYLGWHTLMNINI